MGKNLLTPEITPGGMVLDFDITPDNLRVVFKGDLDTDNVDELYSVPILGNQSEKLNRPPVTDGDVVHFKVSPDSEHVIFKADLELNDKFELYISQAANLVFMPFIRR